MATLHAALLLLLSVSINKLRQLPPITVLDYLYNYDPETGIITRKGITQPLGSLHKPTGYWVIHCKDSEGKRQNIYAHRLAYALYHGKDPYPLEIDHINRDRRDNRISNLRAVSKSENQHNRAPRVKKPRVKKPRICKPRKAKPAICVYKNYNRWMVIIKEVYYGHTDTFEEGIILRDRMIAEHNLDVLLYK